MEPRAKSVTLICVSRITVETEKDTVDNREKHSGYNERKARLIHSTEMQRQTNWEGERELKCNLASDITCK